MLRERMDDFVAFKHEILGFLKGRGNTMDSKSIINSVNKARVPETLEEKNVDRPQCRPGDGTDFWPGHHGDSKWLMLRCAFH